MKKLLVLSIIGLSSFLNANSAAELFNQKCAICHKVEVSDKNTLIAPPINKVIMHVKSAYPNKEDALKFMKDFVLNPDPQKSVCPSIDFFGLMPSQKGVLTPEELDTVVEYAYDTFANTQKKRKKGKMRKKGFAFMKMDANGDGSISKEEFYNFRAAKEGLEPKAFKYDYFFKRIDTNGDGKWDKQEFEAFMKMKD